MTNEQKLINYMEDVNKALGRKFSCLIIRDLYNFISKDAAKKILELYKIDMDIEELIDRSDYEVSNGNFALECISELLNYSLHEQTLKFNDNNSLVPNLDNEEDE